MSPDFDSLLESIKGALSFVDERLSEEPNPPLLMLANAVRDLRAAVVILAEHTSMPRRVPER